MKNEKNQRNRLNWFLSLSLLIRQLSAIKMQNSKNSCSTKKESHDVLLGPAGLFSFAVKSLFDGLKGMHRKFVVRCRAAQFGSEQFIDLFAKHSKCFSGKVKVHFWKSLLGRNWFQTSHLTYTPLFPFSELSRPPSGPSKFLNGNSILNRLNEIRCSNLKRSVQAIELAINNNRKLLDLTSSDESVLLITFQIYQYEVKESALDASGKTGMFQLESFQCHCQVRIEDEC